MKNSAWYHKLWLNKLNDLPLKEDANTAWGDMEQMLDQQLPVGNSSGGTPTPKPVGTTLGTYLGYIVGAAAMLGATAYFTLRSPQPDKVNKVIEGKNIVQITSDTLNSDSIGVDTLRFERFNAAGVDSLLTGSIANSTTVLKTPSIISSAYLINTKQVTSTAVNHSPKTKVPDKTVSEKVVGNQPANGNSIPTATVQQVSPSDPARTVKTRQLPSDLTDNTDSTPPQEMQRQKRLKRSPKAKMPIDTPPYNFGVEAGLNRANNKNTFYIGAFGTYALSPRWLISTGLRMNSPRAFIGNYTRKSYFRPDSMPAFSFTDKRKVLALDIPVTVTYKLSNTLGINAGPVINLPLKQLGIQLGPINLRTDTLMHTKEVYDILNSTKMNRINFGFNTGISLHLSQFDINARYQMLNPYSFSNEFGDNKFKYQTFQIGIGYRFK